MNALLTQFVSVYRAEMRKHVDTDPKFKGWSFGSKGKSDEAIAEWVFYAIVEIKNVIPKRENLFPNRPALEAAAKNVGITKSSKLHEFIRSLTDEDWKAMRVDVGIVDD